MNIISLITTKVPYKCVMLLVEVECGVYGNSLQNIKFSVKSKTVLNYEAYLEKNKSWCLM